ncbi:MAG: DinB family protein [Cyclobacteriaceae bacterium]|nr:DinB family protein [Cyclobacteriaceae bacterium]
MKKTELQERLISNHSSFTGFVRNLSDVIANHSMPGKWTPLQQLSHIEKSVSPVKLAFSLPKFLLSLIFGKSNRSSRTYDELISRYKEKLQAGGKSTTRFLPDPSCDRVNLNDAVDKHVKALCSKIDRFSEAELDRFILPHPLLGKLTLREMIYFTIYHVEHHHSQINPALRQSVA